MSEPYPEHTLLGSQWDAVYDVINAMGFNPPDFARTTTYGRIYNGMVPHLIHNPSGSEFVFDFDPLAEKHAAEWSPGEQQPRDKTTMMEWELVLRVLSVWLENLKRELATPNFWDWLDREREQLASSEPTGETTNTPFGAPRSKSKSPASSCRSRNSWSTTTARIRSPWRLASSSWKRRPSGWGGGTGS